MKAIVISYRDVHLGAGGNDIVLMADVVFVGAGVPGGALSDAGLDGNGLPIGINLAQLNQYANRVEDALIVRATALELPPLARSDCLFPAYDRGA
jgi:hypothetical protein